MFVSNKGALKLFEIKNFSYSVLENLLSLKNVLSLIIISFNDLSSRITFKSSSSKNKNFFTYIIR